jgi:hypothetical protein
MKLLGVRSAGGRAAFGFLTLRLMPRLVLSRAKRLNLCVADV